MNRTEALELVDNKIYNKNLVKHCLAVEAVMRGLAEHFNQDIEKYGLAGLLHDIDYESTKNDLQNHSLIGSKMLEELGIDKDICYAIRAHNDLHKLELKSLMDKCLFVSDPITGLIVASALVLPSKKIQDLSVDNVLNRFKEKHFAKGAKREIIKQCEDLMDLKLGEFVKIALKSMQKISNNIGL